MWKVVHSKGQSLEVSADGRVRTIARTGTTTRRGKSFPVTYGAKELTPCRGRHGYYEVCYRADGVRVKHLVHRLVGQAFVPGYTESLSVDHLNGDKSDNRASNLEWVSTSENTKRQWRSGLVDLRGEKAPGAKLTAKKVRIVRRLVRQGVGSTALAELLDVSESLICKIASGERWTSLPD